MANTINMVNFQGFTHIDNYQRQRKGGRMLILLNDKIHFKRRKDLEVFDEGKTESVLIKILAKNGKKIILGSLYRPLNTDENQLINNICEKTTKATNCKGKIVTKIVLGMDHNMDLLKSSQHKPINIFLETLNELNLLPTITRPSQITQRTATLIDNICVGETLHRQYESTILLENNWITCPW